ncbi:MAG: MaoC family dehydratase [Bacteroidetes bacterium]|nr:MaoC family dehydratase [Bacteroidota bacterium]
MIFRDDEIIEFCRATKDTNEIHDPEFMATLGRRVIVPGMFALAQTVNLEAGFLKNHARSLRVLFNSLLSSGDFVTLCSTIPHKDPSEIRLSAINHKDTLTSKDEYTRLSVKETDFSTGYQGILHRLEVTQEQIRKFSALIGATDPDVVNFLFAVSFASQALLKSIDRPQTGVEEEIDNMINKNTGISPFYHTLEIRIPEPFPVFDPVGSLDYYIHFEREKPLKLYAAYVRCENQGKVIFQSQYKLIGIADRIILRMAKEIKHHKVV